MYPRLKLLNRGHLVAFLSSHLFSCLFFHGIFILQPWTNGLARLQIHFPSPPPLLNVELPNIEMGEGASKKICTWLWKSLSIKYSHFLCLWVSVPTSFVKGCSFIYLFLTCYCGRKNLNLTPNKGTGKLNPKDNRWMRQPFFGFYLQNFRARPLKLTHAFKNVHPLIYASCAHPNTLVTC